MSDSLTCMAGGRPKKQAFRWIAGTSRAQDDPQSGRWTDRQGLPHNALTSAGKLMVTLMQQILATLRAKDVERTGTGLPPSYWVIKNIGEFVQEIRTAADN